MLRFDIDLFKRRVFGQKGSFTDAAVETVELHPEQQVMHPPAIYEDDLSTIRGVAPGVPLEDRLQWITGGKTVLPPSMAYRFRDLRIAQGMAYSGTGHRNLRRQTRRSFYRDHQEVIEEQSAIACNLAATNVYGHWALEQLPREVAIQDMGVEALTLPSVKPFWHEPKLRETLDLHSRVITAAHLRDCWLIQDRAKNDFFAEKFSRIRAKTVRGTDAPPGDLIYLKRGSKDAAKREIENDEAFSEFLQKLGFQIIDVETTSLEEIATALSRAKLTCTIEGSQAAHHFVFAPQGSALLILMPEDRFNHVLKETCDVLEMPFAMILGRVTETGQYAYPESVFAKLLSRALQAID